MTNAFVPSEWGITPNISVAALLATTDHYVTLVEKLKGDAPKKETPKLVNEDDQKQADGFVREIRNALFGTLDSNPILATVLVDALVQITKDVRDFREWVKDDAARNGTAVVQTSETDQILAGLKKWIDVYYNGVVSFGEEQIPEDYPVKTLTDGRIVPDLPRGPNAVSGVPKVKGRFLRFRFHPIDGSDPVVIPEGTMTEEVALRYVSDATYRVERTEVYNMLPHTESTGFTPTGRPKKGHLDMPKDGSSVFIEYRTGTLEAWLPTDAPIEVESDDDDDENEEVTD